MHAVTGPYARRILVEQLGAPPAAVLNATPLEDFGGAHPDPNLVHGRHLAELAFGEAAPDLVAASDGDGDRNMILGRGIFVSPGDSLAMLAAHLPKLPGYRDGLRGIARSMPTSRAADAVAAALGVPLYETPTGWKFFCNLLDADRITICGEESFGTSSNHAREKDGLWAVLAWLNVLAAEGSSLAAIARAHWQRFGRHYFQRHDYEQIDPPVAEAVMRTFADALPGLPGQTLGDWTVTAAGAFDYADPVDGSAASQQGLRIVFGDEARIVLRLSGTGTKGATLRLYLERCERTAEALAWRPEEALSPLAAIAERIGRIGELTGRRAPTLVT
jgi:phosphoglucomutase